MSSKHSSGVIPRFLQDGGGSVLIIQSKAKKQPSLACSAYIPVFSWAGQITGSPCFFRTTSILCFRCFPALLVRFQDCLSLLRLSGPPVVAYDIMVDPIAVKNSTLNRLWLARFHRRAISSFKTPPCLPRCLLEVILCPQHI